VAPVPTEADAIAAADGPASASSLGRDLVALGVEPGEVLLVHSSLSALGWVAGGAQSVVAALLDAVGPTGTIVMPAQSGQLSDPAAWQAPPVPAHWVAPARDALPAFDRDLTPSRGMGAVVECFRALPATVRSGHPTLSFVANGPAARAIVADHPLHPGLGDGSPLGRLHDLGAHVLLLGVGHHANTALHLAEHRADWPGRRDVDHGAPVLVDGQRRWVAYRDLDLDTDDFEAVGLAFEATGRHREGPVGSGRGRRYPLVELVDFATTWFTQHRGR